MADDEDRRVEPRIMTVGGLSLHATPEGIASMQAKAQKLERLGHKPTTSFSEILKAGKPEHAKPQENIEDERPKKGPRPGLAHPVQREIFGRGENSIVVIKG